jgi:hypothetical protein
MTVPVSLGRPFAPEAVEVASSLASRALLARAVSLRELCFEQLM